jgi:hypothetical protein
MRQQHANDDAGHPFQPFGIQYGMVKTGLNNILMNKPTAKSKPGNNEDGEQDIIQPDLRPEDNIALREYSFQRLQKSQ